MVIYDPATGKNRLTVYTVHIEGRDSGLVGVFHTEPEAHQAVRQAMKASHVRRFWCSKNGEDILEGEETELQWHDDEDVHGPTIILRKHTL